jgi:hypothetical protein
MEMDVKTIRRLILVAVLLVALLLVWSYLSTRGVQDPSNNASLAAQFAAQNPQLASADDGSSSDGDAAS